VCETDDEAEEIASSGAMMMALLRRGELIPVPPIDKALRFVRSSRSTARPQGGRRPRHRRARHRACWHRSGGRGYGADEVIVVTITPTRPAGAPTS
jgi:hypothetical protein